MKRSSNHTTRSYRTFNRRRKDLPYRVYQWYYEHVPNWVDELVIILFVGIGVILTWYWASGD